MVVVVDGGGGGGGGSVCACGFPTHAGVHICNKWQVAPSLPKPHTPAPVVYMMLWCGGMQYGIHPLAPIRVHACTARTRKHTQTHTYTTPTGERDSTSAAVNHFYALLILQSMGSYPCLTSHLLALEKGLLPMNPRWAGTTKSRIRATSTHTHTHTHTHTQGAHVNCTCSEENELRWLWRLLATYQREAMGGQT